MSERTIRATRARWMANNPKMKPEHRMGRPTGAKALRLRASRGAGMRASRRLILGKLPRRDNAMLDDDYSVAVHEAGHAVMADRRGATTTDVSIVLADDDDGLTKYFVNGSNSEDRALISLAGWAACSVAGIRRPEAGCEPDFKRARAFLAEPGLPSLNTMRRRAVFIIRQPANRKAVDLIVEALLRHREIDGCIVALAMNVADGRIDRAYWRARMDAEARLRIAINRDKP